MKIAYLINQYPAVSHSFIRREICALEELGIPVSRFTVRRKKDIVDPGDKEEAKKTRCILETGILMLMLGGAFTFLLKPIKTFRTLSKAVQFGKRSERGVLRHLFYVLEACVLVSWCSKADITHIHAHFGTNSTAVALLCKMLGGPTFSFTCHGPKEFDFQYSISLSEKINRAEFVIAISHFGKSQLMRWCDSEHWSKIRIIHCVVDKSFLESKPVSMQKGNRLVCVGRLTEQKGLLLLLEALRKIADENINFEMILAGEGDLRGKIIQKIKELNLEDQVKITGWISGEAVKKELQASIALVLPSSAEGLPVVIMEALALGRPVISTYVAGIPELVTPDCGFLFPSGSMEELVVVLKKLLTTKKTVLENMGKNGSKRVKLNHNSLIEAGKLVKLFQEFSSEVS